MWKMKQLPHACEIIGIGLAQSTSISQLGLAVNSEALIKSFRLWAMNLH